MERLQDAAIRQLNASDGCPVEIDLLDVLAPGKIDGLLLIRTQIRTVPNVQCLEHGVVAQIKLRQVSIGIIRITVSKLQALKSCGQVELRIAHLQTAQVADGFDLAGRIDVDFRVVYLIQRTGNRVALPP